MSRLLRTHASWSNRIFFVSTATIIGLAIATVILWSSFGRIVSAELLGDKLPVGNHETDTSRRAVAEGGPGQFYLRSGFAASPVYTGTASARRAIEQNLVEPLSLATGDFDEDGVADLIGGYANEGHGVLSLYRGNVDAIYPNTPEARRRWQPTSAAGKQPVAPPPFLTKVEVFELPIKPDFIGAGDFNADGHLDLVAAARGGDKLYLIAGDGRGGFAEAKAIELSGRVTALTVGEINRADGLADVIVGIADADRAEVLVFEGPEGALRAQPETFALPAEATALALGRLDGDYLSDLAVAAGQDLIIIHGRDRQLSLASAQRDAVAKAKVDRQSLGVAIKSIAIGNFTDGLHSQIAALGEDGSARVVILPNAAGGAFWQKQTNRWIGANLLLGARVSGGGLDDLVVMDSANRRAHLIGGTGNLVASSSGEIEIEGKVVAAVQMRLSIYARNDLVLLERGQSAPIVASPNVVAAVITVNSAGDEDDFDQKDDVCDSDVAKPGLQCTLRAAIQTANNAPDADTIMFGISSGPQTINLKKPLPDITATVTIDATTQKGFIDTPIIELSGAMMPTAVSRPTTGLTIAANNCVVRGLVINGFFGHGIRIVGSNNIIEGNFIGTDLAGTSDFRNTGHGVFIDGQDPLVGTILLTKNLIGGATARARNVISGNGGYGVYIDGSAAEPPVLLPDSMPDAINATSGNMVYGNYIGSDKNGAAAAGEAFLGNYSSGIYVLNSSGNKIGGMEAGEGNLIVSNGIVGEGSYSGLEIATSAGLNSAASNLVQGNLIGTNSASSDSLGNYGAGVKVSNSSDTTIGGTAKRAANVISGNQGVGIGLRNNRRTLMQGNLIGTNLAGNGNLGNQSTGIYISSPPTPNGFILQQQDNAIGGAATGAGNVIAFNGTEGDNGVVIFGAFNNSILGNSIFSNAGLGIDLGGNGVSDNDAGDGDGGPNNLQNYPVLSGAVNKGASTTITGTLNSMPNTAFRIEFFSNAACDSSGFGQGEIFISFTSVTTNANGTANFSLDLPTAVPLGRSITATATDPNGNTSEFSRCAQVIACPIYPNGFVPFAAVDAKFITAPDANGDRVIVGPSTIAALSTIQSSVALPQFPNEQFCAEVMLAPNLLAIAYVPSATERSGNFSAFGQPLIDPLIGQPFPGNIIPSNRLGGIYAWRVRSFRFLNADLAIAKTDAPDPVLAGNNLTYTITVTNNGPAAATNVVVTDVLTGPQVALVSTTTTAPNGVCTPTSASSIACTLGTLNAGASVSATIIVRPVAPGTLTNTATVKSDFDPNPDNNVAVATTAVLPVADLAVTIADSPDPVLVNNLLTYSINVANNNGPTIATNVVLTSALPAGVTLSSAGATQGTCGALVGGQITCNLGTINVGSSVAVTIIVNVLPVAAGTISNTVSVRGDGSDPNPRNDTATATTVVIPVANLVLTKTTTTLLPGPGDDLSYTLRIANAGPNDAAEVVLADDIPTNTVFKSLSDVAGWTCTKPAAGSTGSISCGIRALANGASTTFTLVVTVGSNVVKDTIITNTARATTSSSDGDMSNNTSTALARIGAPVPLVRSSVGGAVEVGPIAALPQPSANPPTGTFLIENGGNATLFLTPLSVTRLGPDGGKFASPADDRSLFDIRRITPSGDIPLLFTANGVIPVLPGQQVNFRVRFNPIIPTRGCRTTNLAANQALPEMINSQLRLLTQSGVPVDVALVGRLSTAAKLIHPGNPTLPALVTLTQSGKNVKVESWVYDSNMDIYLARYQFFDGTGNPLGDPVDAEFGQSISRAGLVRGQVFGIEQNFETDSQVASVRVTIYDPDNVSDSALSGPGTPPQCTLPTVSAASFNEFGLSSESIVAGFGANLAAGVQVAANNPLPTSLGGTSVRIRDGAGIERPAPLFFVSPAQINYQIPAGVSPGAATVTVMNGNAPVATDILRITQSWPGLFAANGNGAGVAAAVALRVKADGTQSYEPVARFDQALNQNVSIPINPGDPTDQIYLIFYGTGIRNHSVFDAVKMWIGGVESPLLYAGAQGDFAGLDQINVALPRTLSGRGEVDVVLAVGNSVANKVQVNIGGAPNLLANAVSPSFAEMQAQSPSAKPEPLSVIVMPTIKLPARVAAR